MLLAFVALVIVLVFPVVLYGLLKKYLNDMENIERILRYCGIY